MQAGLNGSQALIYEVLLKHASLKASSLVGKTPFKRETVYRILDELMDYGLVVKNDQPGKVAEFEAAHPLKLKDFLARQEEKAKNAQIAIESLLPKLTSEYNFALGKPGVEFYEGKEGIEKVIFDNLSTKGEILAYLDQSTLNHYIPDLNAKYIKQREKLKIKKRNLVLDTAANRELLKNYHRSITEVRLLSSHTAPVKFGTLFQIYDNKVSYVTFKEKSMIGIIIDNPEITEMHRYLYAFAWENAKPL